MKNYLFLLFAVAMLFANCGDPQSSRSESSVNRPVSAATPCNQTTIDRETAIRIAKGDAVDNYKVSIYDIAAEERSDGWRIVFKLKNPDLTGGGPDYLIDKKTGRILNATYNK